MTDSPLRFERRSAGVYPVLFHAGPYYWPVTEDAVTLLKAHAHDPPDAFQKSLVDAVATTRYLRHQVEGVLAGLADREAQLRAAQQMLNGL
jgi:hypothetical protein